MKYFIFDVDGTLMNSAAVDQQCLKQTLHEFGRDYTFEDECFPPELCAKLEALLRELHARGCRCGIVTSRTHYQFDYGFSPLGLDGYFDAVICMEDAPRHKPAPDPLLECLRRMGGTAAEAVYIGDSACDMECAAAAGVKSCLALWGIPEGACIRADIELAAPADALKLI